MKKTPDPKSTTDNEIDLEAAAASAGRYTRKLLDDSELGHTAENLTALIYEKPLQSALVALGVGFVIGAIVRR